MCVCVMCVCTTQLGGTAVVSVCGVCVQDCLLPFLFGQLVPFVVTCSRLLLTVRGVDMRTLLWGGLVV